MFYILNAAKGLDAVLLCLSTLLSQPRRPLSVLCVWRPTADTRFEESMGSPPPVFIQMPEWLLWALISEF